MCSIFLSLMRGFGKVRPNLQLTMAAGGNLISYEMLSDKLRPVGTVSMETELPLRGSLKEAVSKVERQMIEHPTFLETFTPRSTPFYERIDYQVVGRIHEPTSKADYWVMVRAPQES
ncbi:MAG: hypothetical protein KJO28_11155 [Desulfofustis sp.]|nr:hypothetical protein [Desulfofustis sp.]